MRDPDNPLPPRRRRSTRRSSGHGLRLFLAIYPPPSVVEQMLSAGSTFIERNGDHLRDAVVKPIPPEQVHLTVHFLGNVSPRRLDETIESIDRAKKGLDAFTLCPDKVMTWPPGGARNRPRIIAITTDSPPDLVELHRRAAIRFARATRPEPADRFMPHLTLARLQWGRARTASASRPGRPREKTGGAPPEPFDVTEFHLVKSVLQPQGAQHKSIARWPLVRH